MKKSVVAISKCETYELAEIKAALGQVLEPLGGTKAFVKPGDKALVKINLLRGSEPDKAVTTHPSLIEAVIDAVREAGGTPVVGDSPGGPNKPRMIEKMLETTGVGQICERTGTEFVLFDRETTTIKCPQGKLYTSFTAGKAVVDADVVITLPKLKTHGFMKLTGAVKVLFGVIPGLDKIQYHLKVPKRMDFANMLVDIYLAVKPALSIMDAVVAMEGDGPSGGSPKHIGALMASADSIALDFVASEVIGFKAMDVYTNRASVERGLIPGSDGIKLAGLSLKDISSADFKAAKADLADKIPAGLVEFMKNLATSRPYLEISDVCTACGTCAKSCPACAIDMTGKRPRFDYDKCIRCYCCEELCPELAIKRKNHWLVRLLTRS